MGFAHHGNQMVYKHLTSDQSILVAVELHNVPYFFGYKLEIFSFQNNPKNLDPSYKMNLDL